MDIYKALQCFDGREKFSALVIGIMLRDYTSLEYMCIARLGSRSQGGSQGQKPQSARRRANPHHFGE
jgi:hypothetical protein